MADASLFYRDIHDQTVNFIQILDKLETLKARMEADPELAQAAADAAVASGRADLAKIDFDNWSSAVVQLLFAFNSGSPTQASYLYKML